MAPRIGYELSALWLTGTKEPLWSWRVDFRVGEGGGFGGPGELPEPAFGEGRCLAPGL